MINIDTLLSDYILFDLETTGLSTENDQVVEISALKITGGEITDEELSAARADVKSALKSSLDVQGALEGFYLSAALDGADYSPEELSALVDDVTKEELVAIARGCECDMIYTLTGDGSEEDDGEDAADPGEEELRAFEEDENGNPDEEI
jgi:DNA polymerase III epsilon subunit-like protein